MSPLLNPVMPSMKFHVKVRQLKLINLDIIEAVNVHENGVSLNANRISGPLSVTDTNLDWSQVEQLYLALANALTLRNINASR